MRDIWFNVEGKMMQFGVYIKDSMQLTCLIDGDEDKLDKEAKEAHSKESNGCKAGYLPELLAVWLFTAFQQPAEQSK
jgi:hypothetical protein